MKLPIWTNILIVLKQGFTSMNCEDMYKKLDSISRTAVFDNFHSLLDKGLIEIDHSNYKESHKDKRKVFYVLTIPGYDIAEYLEKIIEILRTSESILPEQPQQVIQDEH